MFCGGLIAIKLHIYYSFLNYADSHSYSAGTWLRILQDFLISVNESIILPITPFVLRLPSEYIMHINSLSIFTNIYKAGLPINHILQLRILRQGKVKYKHFICRAHLLNHYAMLPQNHSTQSLRCQILHIFVYFSLGFKNLFPSHNQSHTVF